MTISNNKKIKIACLPVAGNENPYQQLMIQGLNSHNELEAFNGVNDRFFGIIRTVLKYRPHFIHFDWIESYYTRRYDWLTYLDIPFFLVQVFFIKYILRVKIIWTLHNLYPHLKHQRKLHIRVQRSFAKYINSIRLFSAQTLSAAMNTLQQSEGKFKICSEGSYIGYYSNTVSQEEARKKLKIEVNRKVFLFFGTILPYKGLLELVKEFDLANSLLICAGKVMDKEYFNTIKKESGNHIIFFDHFIPRDEVQYFFNAADIVVLPFTEIENSGSLILAMSFGKPVIAPATGLILEKLNGQQHLLYQEGELKQKLHEADAMSALELHVPGENNFHQALKMDWSLFGNIFLHSIN